MWVAKLRAEKARDICLVTYLVMQSGHMCWRDATRPDRREPQIHP